MSDSVRRPPLAVVGLAGLFPGSTDAGGFWRDILGGRDQLREVPPTHWSIEDHYDPDPAAPDKTYARRGAFLSDIDFDPLEWGIPPSTLPATDTSQLLALIVAQSVLEQATSGRYREMDRSRVSVILGVTGGQELLGAMVSRLQRPVWVRALREAGVAEDAVERAAERVLEHYVPWQESTFPGLLGNVVAGRIANRLDLGGTNCITDAACASSMSALSMAANELYLGDSDLVITGGVDTMNDVFMFMCFSKTPALSLSGDCRPFSSAADGTMLGEGIGMVALKRLADAERDGDPIYALVRGVGSSSDGGSTSVYAPVSAGQAQAISRAYEHAGYGPDTVELIEAHGTGTRAGDLAEFEGLAAVFDASGRRERQWCSLGTVKSLIGHTKAAAGAAGLVKTVLALHHRVLPPMTKVEQPDPRLDFAGSAFYLNTRPRPWVRGSGHERRAGVSSFGFGGSNYHVTLSEYSGPGARAPLSRSTDAELILLCGERDDVVRDARLHAEHCDLPGYHAWLSQTTLAAYRADAPVRVAVVATGEEDLAVKLSAAAEALAAGREPRLPGVEAGFGPGLGQTAFLFPGQGSQYLHMGADVAVANAAAMSAWELAADMGSGTPLHDVVFPPAAFSDAERDRQAARLTATQNAQPAIGAASLALLAVLHELGVSPAAVAGHSFGEVTALHAAGVIDAAAMLALAARRGELMAEAASTPGGMLAVAAPIDAVRAVLEGRESPVVIANHNGPRQVVLSGPVEAIGALSDALAQAGIECFTLDVACAFHSPLVAGAVAGLASHLETVDLAPAQLPVYSNTTAEPYPRGPQKIAARLAEQLSSPVWFAEMIERMYADGMRTFVEVGPGEVLTGLVGRILDGRPHAAVALDAHRACGVGALLRGIGRLAAAGVAMDPAALWNGYREVPDPHEVAKPRIALAINGANARPSPAHAPAVPATALSADAPAPSAPAPALPAPDLAAWQRDALRADPIVHNGAGAAAGIAAEHPTASVPAAEAADADALVSIHEHAARAHMAYLDAVARVHEAYLAGYAETVARLDGGARSPVRADAAAGGAGVPQAETAHAPRAPVAASSHARTASPTAGHDPRAHDAGAPVTAGPADPAPARAAASGVPSGVAAALDPAAMGELLLEVVAAKTGYPQEMLAMEMELARDLGIDSIKRVEILSGMRERLPGLPEVDMARLAELATLGQIVDHMSAHATGPVAGGQPVPGAAIAAPAPERRSGANARAASVSRTVPTAVPLTAPGLPMDGLFDGRIAVSAGGGDVARALVDELRAGGVDAELVTTVPAEAVGLVLCDGLDAGMHDHVERALRSFSAARTLAARLGEHGGLLVTVQDSGGSFGLHTGEGWDAGLAALARTAAIEWPRASVKAIDVERDGRDAGVVAAAIAGELLGGGSQLEVGLRADGSRISLVDVARQAQPGAPRLGAADVVVVSGGGRGVTAACAIGLAGATGARLVLLGRTQLRDEPDHCRGLEGRELRRAIMERAAQGDESLTPAALGAAAAEIEAVREIRETLRAIEHAGGAARYVALDVADGDAVSSALATVRTQWGPITAVIHGAGVLADRLIAEKTDAEFLRVYATKVEGLRSLLDATAGDPVSVLCLFSSVAARRGNAGQADYAMANEVLNRVAQAQARLRHPSCLVRSIGWGPWAGGMVTAALADHFRAQGVELLSPEVGVAAFLGELAGAIDDGVEVILGAGGSAGEHPAASNGGSAGEHPAASNGGSAGEHPAASNAAQRHRAEIVVSEATHPQLAGHAIGGSVVVPVAYAVEWMARAAASLRPDRSLAALEDIRVLKGIMLGGFDNGAAARLTVGCAAVSGSSAALELVAPDQTIAYRATADWSPRDRLALPAVELARFEAGAPYEARSLFHGPPFQVLSRVEGIGDHGIRGVLRGVREMDWGGEPWLTDPAALDGVLQLSVLWIERVLGLRALPTAIGSLRQYAPPVAGEMHCSVVVADADDLRMRGSAVVFDDRGEALFELLDLEAHVLPDAP